MIDTIVLLLSSDMFRLIHPERFTPSASWVANKKHWGATQSKQNPSKKELLGGIYKPRLTLSHRMNIHGAPDIVLRIELSLPKVFFGNNFEELRYKDFPPLITQLCTTLQTMGVEVETGVLSHAPVCAVHYSKNIILTDGSTPYHYIRKIKEACTPLSLDVNQTDYRNEGHSYKWHCNAYEVVFYDKIKDLEKAKMSNKRVLEKDNEIQRSLLDKFKIRNKYEVFRMEVRLNKRQKMKSLFTSLDINTDLTFKKLFKPSISKKILTHYLDKLENKRPALLDYKYLNDKNLLSSLIFNNPTHSPKHIMQIFGLTKALESFSLRELKIMFPEREWHRLMANMKDMNLPHTKSPLLPLRKYLEKA